MTVVVGVDGGGTHTRAVLLDGAGNEVGRAEGPAGLVDPGAPMDAARVVEGVVRAALVAARLEPPAEALWAGLAGAGAEAVRQQVSEALAGAGVARDVFVGTDVEAAHHDAFGNGPGILLVAGTGSVAWGLGASGARCRVGGWGALLGDEGSGYDLAQRALRAVARAHDGRGPRTRLGERLLGALGLEEPEALVAWAGRASKADVAALAPHVAAVAAEGDGPALRIVSWGVEELQKHVAAVLEALAPWPQPPVVALAGGLIRPGGPLRAQAEAMLERLACPVLSRPVVAERGAARLALERVPAE